jgi:phosphatidylglycerophosphatase A
MTTSDATRPGGAPGAFRRGLVLAIATVGFLSVLPYKIVPFKKWKGGGLLGSLAGWAVLLAFPWPPAAYWTAAALLLAVSVWSSHWAERYLGHHDDPRIIIDEVIGVWLAAAGLPRAWGWLTAALVLFRVFDVFKGPWGNAAARLPGGWGVTADDVLAGIIANVLLRLALAFGPWAG